MFPVWTLLQRHKKYWSKDCVLFLSVGYLLSSLLQWHQRDAFLSLTVSAHSERKHCKGLYCEARNRITVLWEMWRFVRNLLEKRRLGVRGQKKKENASWQGHEPLRPEVSATSVLINNAIHMCHSLIHFLGSEDMQHLHLLFLFILNGSRAEGPMWPG